MDRTFINVHQFSDRFSIVLDRSGVDPTVFLENGDLDAQRYARGAF